MRIEPVQGVEAESANFKGFPPVGYAPNTIHSKFRFPRIPEGAMILNHPVPEEGVGEKLDIIA